MSGDGVDVAVALRFAPGEQPVAAQNDSVAVRLLFDGSLEHHSEFESGTLPGQPHQFVIVESIELLHLFEPVGCGGKRDCAIRMQMIDVPERQEAVQRRID